MKNNLTFFILLCLLNFSILTNGQTENQAWRPGEQQIKISEVYYKDFNHLKLNFDYIAEDNNFRLYVTPSELGKLQALNIPYTVEIEDLNNYKRDFWILEEQYHTYQEIINLADSLEQNFSGICKKYLFGTSMGGRQCAALKISDNVSVDENESEVMFDGGIHGDEVGGSENIIRFARDLCIKYGTDPVVTDLINNREIWLYLMVNPDGRANNVRYNNNFVDLNRDWGYMWDGEGSSPGAFSQVETKALRSCMYTNQFVVHTSYHSGTLFVSYPWSYRPSQCLDFSHTNHLASIYASTSGYGGTLPYQQGYQGMYPINGSTKDGNYAMMGSVSWSIEISSLKHPPNSQILQFYNWNYPAMMALIQYSGYGIEGVVTDAQTGLPVAARIHINNYYPSYTDPEIGDYHKYVLPGSTYSVTAHANGYESQTISNVVVTLNSSTVVNFQLQPGGGYYADRFSVSRIPDNNYADEGLTPAALGMPDNINYSIGKSGWCVLDLQYPVQNLAGADIKVFEGDATPEGYQVHASISMDGPWTLLGTGSGTTEFDLAALQQARYIKITDDGDGLANVADAGFDLDAVQSLHIVPVELTSLTAEQENNNVVIRWATSSELNNSGFEIQRTTHDAEWETLGFITGSGTSSETHEYSFTDNNPSAGSSLYRLKQIDLNGSYKFYGPVEVNSSVITSYSLSQNYPNPFNPLTRINYSVAGDNFVTIKLYDVLGKEIAVLVNENREPGNYDIEFSSSEYASGIYYYTMKAGHFYQSRKMVILK